MIWIGSRKMFRTLKIQYSIGRNVMDLRHFLGMPTQLSPLSRHADPAIATIITLTKPRTTEQVSDDSTFNILQLNSNGIGNTLTELGVVLERNKNNCGDTEVKALTHGEICLRPWTKRQTVSSRG